MKNFDWKDENEQPTEEEKKRIQEEVEKQIRIQTCLLAVYKILSYIEVFVGIYAAFAWLWNTQWVSFSMFLFFIVYAVEAAVTVAQYTVFDDGGITIDITETGGDDQDGDDGHA